MLLPKNQAEPVKHLGQFWISTYPLSGSVFGQRQHTQQLFYTQRSEGFTANTLSHIVNGTYRKAGISGATSHSGRRTGITNLAERGVGVRVLMALAGHSNMATTQRCIDLRPAMLKAAVDLV